MTCSSVKRFAAERVMEAARMSTAYRVKLICLRLFGNFDVEGRVIRGLEEFGDRRVGFDGRDERRFVRYGGRGDVKHEMRIAGVVRNCGRAELVDFIGHELN